MDTNPYEAPIAPIIQQVDPRVVASLHNQLLRCLVFFLALWPLSTLSRWVISISPVPVWTQSLSFQTRLVGWAVVVGLPLIVVWALGLVRHFRLCGYPRWTPLRILFAPIAVVSPYGLVSWIVICLRTSAYLRSMGYQSPWRGTDLAQFPETSPDGTH
jgi:hypothetical protein